MPAPGVALLVNLHASPPPGRVIVPRGEGRQGRCHELLWGHVGARLAGVRCGVVRRAGVVWVQGKLRELGGQPLLIVAVGQEVLRWVAVLAGLVAAMVVCWRLALAVRAVHAAKDVALRLDGHHLRRRTTGPAPQCRNPLCRRDRWGAPDQVSRCAVRGELGTGGSETGSQRVAAYWGLAACQAGSVIQMGV